MTIHLPDDLSDYILAAVQKGRFASADDVVAEAVRNYLGVRRPDPTPEEIAAARPIWEEIAEIAASVPEEEWAKLPVDGAEQHDHYIYGTPKRPPAP
jgi:Arc/MetJ-type ribon-helix-helix transcriptional regulator